MKITVNRRFVGFLDEIASFCSTGTQLPILNFLYMKAEDFSITLRAASPDVSAELKLPVEEGWIVEEPGEALIETKVILPLLKRLKNEQTAIVTYENQRVSVAIKKSKTDIPVAYPPSEFPSFSQAAGVKAAVSPEMLRSLMKIPYATAKNNQARPILNGMVIQVEGEKMVFLATDSHRFARMETVMPNAWEAEREQAVFEPHKKTFALMAKHGGEMFMFFDRSYVSFEFNGYTIRLRKLEGNYPDTSRIVPEKEQSSATVEVAQLLEAVTGAQLVANISKVEYRDGKITVSANGEKGEFTEEVEAEGEKDFQVALNNKYLEDTLGSIDSPQVRIGFTGQLSPVLLHPSEGEGEIHLLLPVRV